MAANPFRSVAQVVFTLANTTIADAFAQTRKPNAEVHEGFWVSAGVGLGSLRDAAAYNVRNPYFGLSIHLATGATLSQRVLAGVEFDRWRGGAYYGSYHRANFLSAGARLYPSDTAGFWVRLGGGAVWSSYEWQEYSGRGAAIAAGAGYDFGISPSSSWHIEAMWLLGVAGQGTFRGDKRPANPAVYGIARWIHYPLT